jgi:hypothetical protein
MAMTPITPTEQALLDLNAKLRGELAALKRSKAETDDTKDPKPTPLPEDTSSDDDADEWEPDPGKPGRVRRKKVNTTADDDTDQDRGEAPKPSGASRAFALAVVNSVRRAHGQSPLTRLQDESVLPGGVVPTDPEEFAKCVANAARKARGKPPLEPNEFISLRELRGGR